jgi:hypothetical protein
MSSADQDEKLAQFRSLTGAPEPMARSYLEATNWDIEVPASSTRDSNNQTAAETFFENSYQEDAAMPNQQPTAEVDDDDIEEWEAQQLEHEQQNPRYTRAISMN